MKTILLSLLLSISLTGNSYADINDGLYAANKGDYKTAFKEWHPLAKMGFVEAQTNIGILYYDGKGVRKDYKQAAIWFRNAAEQGFAEAQTNLGLMYGKGEGVSKDLKQAIFWFRKAAEQGHAKAQNILDEIYESDQNK